MESGLELYRAVILSLSCLPAVPKKHDTLLSTQVFRGVWPQHPVPHTPVTGLEDGCDLGISPPVNMVPPNGS